MGNSKFLDGLSSKLADRWLANLLTPAFVFWAGGLVAAMGKFGWQTLQAHLNQLSDPQQIALIIFSLLIITASAFVVERFNFATLRWLEGYWPWWLRPLRTWLIQQQHDRYTQAETQWNTLFAKRETQGLSPNETEDLVQLEAKLKRIPAQLDQRLPTPLGNLLRAAELRPFNKYGLDAILCWPRFWLVLPQQARQDLAVAQNELNTAVQVWLWSLLFCIWSVWTVWVVPIGLLSAVFAYRWALDAAGIYADLLEAAFDLYRFDLYQALHWPLPKNQEEEKKLAAELNTYLARGYAAQNFN